MSFHPSFHTSLVLINLPTAFFLPYSYLFYLFLPHAPASSSFTLSIISLCFCIPCVRHTFPSLIDPFLAMAVDFSSLDTHFEDGSLLLTMTKNYPMKSKKLHCSENICWVTSACQAPLWHWCFQRDISRLFNFGHSFAWTCFYFPLVSVSLGFISTHVYGWH